MDIDEQTYLAAYDASRYPRPSLAVDVVLLTVRDDALQALLLRRTEQPHLGRWSLPGTFLRIDETLDEAAARALRVKTGLDGVYFEQLYTFGDPARDPRTRVLSVAYCALVTADRLSDAVAARADASLGLWPVKDGTAVDGPGDDAAPLLLAFDHATILATAVKRIRGKLGYTNIGFELLGEEFTLRDLRHVYEAILAKPLNKDSFRRTILDSKAVEPTGRVLAGVGHRPPTLYRFRRDPDDEA
jgi:8-oxo-dGTP diphosphatase